MLLKDRIALITGSGRGIGRAIAQLFATEGAAVFLTARTEKELSATAEGITQGGGRAAFVKADLANEADCRAAFEKAVRLPRCALGDAPSGEDHSEVERGTALALSQELFATAFGAAAVAAGFEAHNQRCNFFTVPASRTGQTK